MLDIGCLCSRLIIPRIENSSSADFVEDGDGIRPVDMTYERRYNRPHLTMELLSRNSDGVSYRYTTFLSWLLDFS